MRLRHDLLAMTEFGLHGLHEFGAALIVLDLFLSFTVCFTLQRVVCLYQMTLRSGVQLV